MGGICISMRLFSFSFADLGLRLVLYVDLKCSDHMLVYGYTLCSSLHNATLLVYSSDPGRDSGEYVCHAVNKAGTAQSTVLVIVTT